MVTILSRVENELPIHGLEIDSAEIPLLRAAVERSPVGTLHEHLHIALLCLTRCKTHIRHVVRRTAFTELATCPGIATWSKEVAPGASVYSCDKCYATLDADKELSELPYAHAVRQYQRLSYSVEAMKQARLEDLLNVAMALLRALPPCKGHVHDVCPRCKYVRGPAVALCNLEEVSHIVSALN